MTRRIELAWWIEAPMYQAKTTAQTPEKNKPAKLGEPDHDNKKQAALAIDSVIASPC